MSLTRRVPRPAVSATQRLAFAALVVFCAAALTVVGPLAAAPASAHDALLSTDPANGATVATAPARVTLTFDEPALGIGTTLRVIGPGGDVQSGPPRLVDSTVTQELAPGIPAGSYRIVWRVTSADGHPVSGEATFTAAAANPRAPTSGPPPTSAEPGAVRAATGLGWSTWLWVVLAVVVLGGASAIWFSRQGARRR